jgi:hypothetical protein
MREAGRKIKDGSQNRQRVLQYLGAVCRDRRAAVRDGNSMHHLGARLVTPRQLSGEDFPDENREGVYVNLFGDGLVTQHLRRLIRRSASGVRDSSDVPVNRVTRL